jgi:hypothetical protein
MGFENILEGNANEDKKLRIIKTLRGQESIDEAIANGARLIIKKVAPFQGRKSKSAILRDRSKGEEFRAVDFRDIRIYSDNIDVVKNWTYEPCEHDFTDVAAYVIPHDIKEGEIVLVEDLIQSCQNCEHNPFEEEKLKSWKAIWFDKELTILNPPSVGVILVG